MITKIIPCKSVGIDCDFVARAETVKKVLEKITTHARSAHKNELKEMEKYLSLDEIMEDMKMRIRSEL